MPITWLSQIFQENLFPAENAGNMPEIAVFANFVRTFSLYFVVFSLKNINNNQCPPLSMVHLSIKLIFVAGTF